MSYTGSTNYESMVLVGEDWKQIVIFSKICLLVLDLMSETSLWSITNPLLGPHFYCFPPSKKNVPFASQWGGNENKHVKIFIFVFSPFKSPPEGVWKIDPKVKNGPLGQIWKNHKFYEISFSPIKSPPEGSEKSTQRSKMIKNVKIKTKIKNDEFYNNFMFLILTD